MAVSSAVSASPSPADPAQDGNPSAHQLGFAMLYAAAAFVLRVVYSPTVDAIEFTAGALIAIPFDILVGGVIAIPLRGAASSDSASAQWGPRVFVAVLAGIVLSLHVLVTPRLPGAIELRTVLRDGEISLAIGLGTALVCAVLSVPLANQLRERLAHPGGRVADGIAVLTLACMSLGAMIAGFGPLYAGATHPVIHVALAGDRVAPPEEPEGAALPHRSRHRNRDEHHEHHEEDGHSVADHQRALIATPEAEETPPGQPPRSVILSAASMYGAYRDDIENVDTEYPACRTEDAAAFSAAALRRRSVILVMLRELGAKEYAGTGDAGSSNSALPTLHTAAEAGVIFDRVYAAGTRIDDALVAALAGQPAPVEQSWFASTRVPHLPGVAAQFRQNGWRAGFFGGAADVALGRGLLLNMTGFDHVDRPEADAEGLLSRPGVLTGRADLETYEALQDWADARREADEPYLAVVSNYGQPTPGFASPITRGEGPEEWWELQDRLAFTDASFASLYDWYNEHERERGTVLIVTGHQPSPAALPGAPAVSVPGEIEWRFRQPLILVGLDEEELEAARGRSHHVGAQTDLPQTMLGLIGDPRAGCFYGRDLLNAPEIEGQRAPASVGGRERSLVYLHRGDLRWVADLSTPDMSLLEARFVIHDVADTQYTRDLFAEDDPDLAEMRGYLGAYVATMQRYTRTRDRFAPPIRDRAPSPRTELPVLYGDRGLTTGPGETDLQTPEHVAQARREGLDGIALDIHMTRDGALVLAGQGVFGGSTERLALTVSDIPRAQLSQLQQPDATIEELVRDNRDAQFVFHLHFPARRTLRVSFLAALRQTVATLERRGGGADRVVFAADDPRLVHYLARRTDIPVLMTAAVDGPDWATVAHDAGADGVLLSLAIASPELVQRSHGLGQRVFLGGVSARRALAPYRGDYPDGVITNRVFTWPEAD